jgi:hypothetical protein
MQPSPGVDNVKESRVWATNWASWDVELAMAAAFWSLDDEIKPGSMLARSCSGCSDTHASPVLCLGVSEYVAFGAGQKDARNQGCM